MRVHHLSRWRSGGAWPLAAHAQATKLPTIGFFGQSTRSAASEWAAAFVQRLRELGWIDGRNVAIEYRWGKDATNASPSSKLHRTSRPPSTIRTEPVTYDASSEASQRMG